VKARVLSGAILLPLAVALILLGGVPFLVGVVAMCGVAAWEAAGLFGAMGSPPLPERWRWLAPPAAAVLLSGIDINQSHPGAARAALALALVGGLVALVLVGEPKHRFLFWAITVAALVYTVGLGSHFIVLRAAKQGLQWTLLACAVTWATDIGAFFVGRRFGAHPFFSTISPKKTLEGAAGGLLAGVAAALAEGKLAGLGASVYQLAIIGVTVSAVAQIGDLAESLLKREAGVKDSGTLIPGHGGILDRIDSLLLAVTVTYYWSLVV